MLQHDTNGKKKELLIRSPSPLKRSEGSSLLGKTRQSSSSPKIDERERRELLYLVIGKKWASLPCMGKGRDPLAGPLPQHLKEAESPLQLHDQKKLAPSASWSTIRERRAPGRPRFLFKRENRAPLTVKRRDWSSPQPSTRHEQPCSRPLKQQQSPLRATFGKKTSFTSC